MYKFILQDENKSDFKLLGEVKNKGKKLKFYFIICKSLNFNILKKTPSFLELSTNARRVAF